MAVVAGVFGRRYTQKQKTSFMNYIGTRAQELGDKAVADGLDQSGASACRNIYLGSLNHADFILTAPYDTPARTLFSGVGYYPLSPRKNMTWDSLELLTKCVFIYFERKNGSKKGAHRRHPIHLIILFKFKAVAERRQWSSAASKPRRKTRVKLCPHFWAAKVPSHQICRLRSASR